MKKEGCENHAIERLKAGNHACHPRLDMTHPRNEEGMRNRRTEHSQDKKEREISRTNNRPLCYDERQEREGCKDILIEGNKKT